MSLGVIQADAKLGLAALTEEVVGLGADGSDRFGRERIAEGKARHREETAELFASTSMPILPERLLAELFGALPHDSIILADPGTPCPYVAAYWELPKPGRWLISPRAFGALGYALPADKYYSVDFRRSDHAAIASAYGMCARQVSDPAELGAAMREALTHPRPYLLDVVTQPLEEARAPVSKWIA